MQLLRVRTAYVRSWFVHKRSSSLHYLVLANLSHGRDQTALLRLRTHMDHAHQCQVQN